MNVAAYLLKIRMLIAFVIFIAGQVTWAAVELIQWQPQPNYPKIILPKRESETAEQAVERYLHLVQKNKRLSDLFRGSAIGDFSVAEGTVSILQNRKASPGARLETSRLRVAMIANQSSDLTDGARINRMMKTFVSAGGDPVVIGLSADIGLNKKDAEDFRNQVADRFDILVGLGGEDVDPRLYGEEVRHAVNVNRRRDVSELQLIKAYKKAERGVYFGICRGHQLGAVADGHTLFQDISKDGLANGDDHIAKNSGYSYNNSRWHHLEVEDSLFLRFLDHQKSPLVNSVHHQAVRENPKARSTSVAKAGEVVEALEAKNKLSFSVQFHPEFGADVSGNAEFSNLGFNLIRNIFAYSRLKRAELISTSAPQCRKLFRAI